MEQNKQSFKANYRILWIASTIAFLMLSLVSGYSMYAKFTNDQLWGYLPLAFLFSSYFFLSLSYQLLTGKKRNARRYLLATVAGLSAGLSFPPIPALPLVILTWVIIYFLLDQEETIRKKLARCYHVFIIWNIISTYWVANTAFAAGLIAISVNSFLMCIPIFVFLHLRKYISKPYQFLLIASAWIAFEYFHFRWELHWPWLTLGHYFMNTTSLVQWYKITGVFGGSLWILATSWSTYKLLLISKQSRHFHFIKTGLIVAMPILLSIMVKWSPGTSDTVSVGVIQPNFEPHYQKDVVTQDETVDQFVNLAEDVVDSIDVLILPETFLRIQLNSWDRNKSILKIKNFISRHPHLKFISGLSSYRVLERTETADDYTRYFVSKKGDTTRWENHNSAVFLEQNKPYEIYYKDKFVPGAEFFPFKKIFFFLKPLIEKLGGSQTSMKRQEHRTNFILGEQNIVAPVICYESIFGEFDSEYIEAGATWMAIMTNDGWWDNTAGHKQHLALAKFRSIEQGRAIARSANSGISGFIMPDGSIHKATKYGVPAVIHMDIPLLESRTIYSRYGDILGRVAGLMVLGAFFYSLRKKFVDW